MLFCLVIPFYSSWSVVLEDHGHFIVQLFVNLSKMMILAPMNIKHIIFSLNPGHAGR